MKNYDTDVKPPIDSVSIIMPSYNEETFIETAVLSIKDQSIIKNYPEYFEFVVVDSNSTDNTVELAKPYVDKVISAPRGKLTARNLATDMSNGNIIVSVDADTFYPHHWLNTLLKPFSDPKYNNIVGVNGSTIDRSIIGIPSSIRNILELIDKMMCPRKLLGRNSAYYKHAYYLVGKFDERINQFNMQDMLHEEEMGFGDRMSKIGTVIYKMNASCLHLGGQKIACRWNFENKDACIPYGFGKDRF
jgi:glycosyltransferase involved in cell wall biosynthesis